MSLVLVHRVRLALCVCALTVLTNLAAGKADPFDTASGLFVAFGGGHSGTTITIQQENKLMVYSVAQTVAVRERADDGAWQSVTLESIAQGEPVQLTINPAGLVTAVDAQYATVTTRLLEQKNGYLITTAGQAYRLNGKAALVESNLAFGTFLRLHVDPSNNTAFDLTASTQPLTGGPLAQPIEVTVTVTVPLNTPTRDVIYMTTDAANWVPNGVRMSPLNGNRWTATLTLGKGSVLKYKYTRGSWGTAEVNQAGIEIPNRSLSITKTANTQQVDDVVLRWADLPS